jgi:hypothetical protein
MTCQASDVNEQMLALWEAIKPIEAASLKFIAMDESGSFAGQFTVECDSHGDRYFVIRQDNKTGKWSISCDLASGLDAQTEASSKKSARTRSRYEAVISSAFYRLNLETSNTAKTTLPLKRSSHAGATSSHTNGLEKDLFREFKPLVAGNSCDPGVPTDPVAFPTGKYFIGDPLHVVPSDLWPDYVKSGEGDAVDLEGVGRSVFYRCQYPADDEGFAYPSGSGLIGLTCVDGLGLEQFVRLQSLGRLIEFSDVEQDASYNRGKELAGNGSEAFLAYRDRKGNIFLGGVWFRLRSQDSISSARIPSAEHRKGRLVFSVTQMPGVDPSKALIYMWEIISTDQKQLIGRYVGKSSRGEDRPLTHYARNVANLLEGKPYRKEKPDGFRRIHHALAAAVIENHRVKLSFVANASEGDDLNQLERQCITDLCSSGPESWQLND